MEKNRAFQYMDYKEKFEHILGAITETVEAQFGIFYLKQKSKLRIFCHSGFTTKIDIELRDTPENYEYDLPKSPDYDAPIGITAYAAISGNSVRLHGEGIYRHRSHTGKADKLLQYIDFKRKGFYSKDELSLTRDSPEFNRKTGSFVTKSILLVPVYKIPTPSKTGEGKKDEKGSTCEGILGVLKVENKKRPKSDRNQNRITPFSPVDQTLLEIIAETFAVEYWREEDKWKRNIAEFLNININLKIKRDDIDTLEILKGEQEVKRFQHIFSLLNLCREYERKGQYDRCIDILNCIIRIHVNTPLRNETHGFIFSKYNIDFREELEPGTILSALRRERDGFCYALLRDTHD